MIGRSRTRGWGAAVFLVLLLLARAAAAQDQNVGLRMDVDKHQVKVGETLTLTIQFKQIGTGNMALLGLPQISTPLRFQVGSSFSMNRVSMENNQTVATSTRKIELTAAQPGEETLGPALGFYQDAQGQKREIKSNLVTVTVLEKSAFSIFGKKPAAPAQANPPAAQGSAQAQPPTPPSGSDDLRGLKPLLPDNFRLVQTLIWLAVLVLTVGFVWRKLRKGAPGPKARPVGRQAQLREAWKKLGDEDLSGKEFCAGLSRLVCECLEFRFGFPAVNYTTEQVLGRLAQERLTQDESAAVEKVLRACDRVLYADANLTGRDNLRTLAGSLLPKGQRN